MAVTCFSVDSAAAFLRRIVGGVGVFGLSERYTGPSNGDANASAERRISARLSSAEAEMLDALCLHFDCTATEALGHSLNVAHFLATGTMHPHAPLRINLEALGLSAYEISSPVPTPNRSAIIRSTNDHNAATTDAGTSDANTHKAHARAV